MKARVRAIEMSSVNPRIGLVLNLDDKEREDVKRRLDGGERLYVKLYEEAVQEDSKALRCSCKLYSHTLQDCEWEATHLCSKCLKPVCDYCSVFIGGEKHRHFDCRQ